MSALRQLVGWLGAALWLRWRLAAMKARRLFGGGRPLAAAGAGPGFQLAPEDIPVEGVDYDEDELPPELLARLEDTRAQLLDHARGRVTRRTRRRRARRRRTLSLATAALVTLGVLGAGATALVTGSTGVPEVDRLLGIYEAELEEPQVPGGIGGDDVQLRPDRGSASVEVPIDGGSRSVVGSFYVARDGNVCSAVAEGRDSNQGWLSCVPQNLIAQRLAQDGGFLQTVTPNADTVAVAGLVSGSVTRISGQGPNGPLDIRLGEPWMPGPSGLARLKPFIAVGTAEAGRPGGGADGPDVLNSRESYVFEAVTDNGDRIQIRR